MGSPGRDHALLTDLYELTMAGAYFAEAMNESATFELFVRELPETRNFLVACGLDPALDYLETLSFGRKEIDYLRGLGIFEEPFLQYLEALSFTGDVWAMPEGEAVFPQEPLLRVRAPLIEGQIVETYLLNCVGFSSSVASKAARMQIASGGRPFVDFSARRDQGADASLLAARAAFVGGASATSNVLAASRYGIRPSGTMAHSFIMSFPDEATAFRAFARRFPGNAVFLIDTYDTIEGAKAACAVADELAGEGVSIKGVRIDSGDLHEFSRKVREILDGCGHPEIEIFVSGDLDEYRIESLVNAGAPVDAFGVGTQLGTSGDAPSLGVVYKLAEDSRGPKRKTSPGKTTIAGTKQVWRLESGSFYSGDVIASQHDQGPPGSRPLLSRVMTQGKKSPAPALAETQERCRTMIGRLPPGLRALDLRSSYPVSLAGSLSVKA